MKIVSKGVDWSWNVIDLLLLNSDSKNKPIYIICKSSLKDLVTSSNAWIEAKIKPST